MGNEVNKLCSVGFDPGTPGGDMTALALYDPTGLVVCIYCEGPEGHELARRRLSAVRSLNAKGFGVRWRKRERVA